MKPKPNSKKKKKGKNKETKKKETKKKKKLTLNRALLISAKQIIQNLNNNQKEYQKWLLGQDRNWISSSI